MKSLKNLIDPDWYAPLTSVLIVTAFFDWYIVSDKSFDFRTRLYIDLVAWLLLFFIFVALKLGSDLFRWWRALFRFPKVGDIRASRCGSVVVVVDVDANSRKIQKCSLRIMGDKLIRQGDEFWMDILLFNRVFGTSLQNDETQPGGNHD